MHKASPIHFIMTGGTIDSFYDGTKDTTVPLKHSAIPEFIRSLKLSNKMTFTQICMKDSRELTKSDLRRILRTVEGSLCKHIIITHGTYTMPDTARYIKVNYKRRDKTIIFTGSMIPITGFSPSDGPFHLGFSIAKVQELPPGVYVCMNGTVFKPNEVIKLVKEGKYTSIFNK